MGGLGFFHASCELLGWGVSFINLPFSAWMGAWALLTVCRFENLVTGLNLPEQFEFHVRAPLAAHICRASTAVPQLCWETLGARGHSLGAGMLEKGRGSWGLEEAEGRERREAPRRGEVRRCQPPQTVLSATKRSSRAVWNFGKILEYKQSSRELCLTQMTQTAASQIYLVRRAGRKNSDVIPGGEEDDGQNPFSSTVWWDWAQVGCSHQPPHCSIIIPYQTGRCPLHGVFRVVYGMCDSRHTIPGVMDRAWPRGCGHCKSGCPQALWGSICWSVCYGCSLKYILKRKLILKRKYQVFCSKQSHNRIFSRLFQKHFCRTPVGRLLEMCSDIFLAGCSSDLTALFCCGNLSPSLLEGLLGPACLSEYFSNLAFMFGTRGANQFHASQENPLS